MSKIPRNEPPVGLSFRKSMGVMYIYFHRIHEKETLKTQNFSGEFAKSSKMNPWWFMLGYFDTAQAQSTWTSNCGKCPSNDLAIQTDAYASQLQFIL